MPRCTLNLLPQKAERNHSAYCAIDPRSVIATQESSEICKLLHSAQPPAGNSLDHIFLKCSSRVKTAKGTLKN